jgi:hypothetical protein
LSNEEVDQLLREVFNSFGDINSVSLSDFKSGDGDGFRRKSRFGHVTFAKKKSLESALNASDNIYREIASKVCEKWGMDSLIRPRKIRRIFIENQIKDTNLEDLKARVDETLAQFEDDEKVSRRMPPIPSITPTLMVRLRRRSENGNTIKSMTMDLLWLNLGRRGRELKRFEEGPVHLVSENKRKTLS